jgi:hypothetical protein
VYRILRGLTSCRLRCGCTVGLYETYDGRVVSILDARGDYCRQPQHAPGSETDDEADSAGPRPADVLPA